VHTEAPGGSPEQSAAFKLIIYSKDGAVPWTGEKCAEPVASVRTESNSQIY
jgi:hypothetical protein